VVVLGLLSLVFFGPLVLHPSWTLYSDHSDLLAETLPAKRFLVRSWQQTGEVPLWCPHAYAGMPFIHDVKVAAFYPPHLPLYLLPEDWLGAALSWLTLAHVLLAGCTMFAYARWQGLQPPAALVAAIGYMFAGKWMLYVLAAGHTFLLPLAWLPLVVLWLEQALRRRSWLRCTWAGAAFGMIVLGAHPQATFYAGLFVALWSLGPALEVGRGARRAALLRWLVMGAWTAAVAAAVSAVELLPAVEAATQATRGLGVPATEGLAGTVLVLLRLVGPAVDGPQWEGRAGFGALWLATAALAPVLCRGRVRFQALVAGLLLVFALGGGTLLQRLPGFSLFQLHSRILFPAALPVSLLAGTTLQALDSAVGADARRRCRRVLWSVLGVAWLLAVAAVTLDYQAARSAAEAAPSDLLSWVRGWDLRAQLYAPLLLVTTLLAGWLVGPPMGRRAVWSVLLLGELWVIAWPLVRVGPAAEVYEPSACVRYLNTHREYEADGQTYAGRVLDRGLADKPSTTPLSPALAMVLGLEPLRGYNSVDVLRYQEYLQFVTDVDRPIRPREGPLGFPILDTFLIKNKALLDLLGTEYLLQPSSSAAESGWDKVAEDERPEAYLVIAGGVQPLPPFIVYRNPDVLPRAFVVPQAEALPEHSGVLAALKGTDFLRKVWVEGDLTGPPTGGTQAKARPAKILRAEPNRVAVEAEGPGWLVLTDVWYPGWNCTVGGREEPVRRANFLFRAVPVTEGTHEVVFTFSPASYRWGRIISLTALAVVAGVSLLAALRWRR
jgi:hypothetical protein